jgi:hypothetical protein
MVLGWVVALTRLVFHNVRCDQERRQSGRFIPWAGPGISWRSWISSMIVGYGGRPVARAWSSDDKRPTHGQMHETNA